MLLALEVDEATDASDTPSAPALLDYADRLGKAADALAARDVLAAPATVLEQITAANDAFHERNPGTRIALDGARMVTLAAAGSGTAAVNARLEIYSRALQPVRALRLTQAGLILPLAGKQREKQDGLTVEAIREKVRNRFPDLATRIPREPKPLRALLREAGFDLRWHTGPGARGGVFLPPRDLAPTDATSTVSVRRLTRATTTDQWTARTPDQRLRLRANAQLDAAASRPGFRLLTVRYDDQRLALATLTEPGREWRAEPVDVSTLFMDSLRRLVAARPRPTWETILEADNAEPGSRDAMKFSEYTTAAWGDVEKELLSVLEAGAGAGGPDGPHGVRPLLLHDASVMARYGGMGTLARLAEQARRGGPGGSGRGLWLLSARYDPTSAPRLDGTTVALEDREEWICLNHPWVVNDPGEGRAA